jgi:outer membrane lipoprotein carrier protein
MKLTLNLLVFCSLLLALAAHAQPGAGRSQLDQFSAGLESLYAGFEQRVIASDGSVQDTSNGQVWLKRPRLFRWEYGGDFPELVVADGRTIWIYDETLEQVTIKDQSEAAVNSPLTILTEPTQLDAQFEVREMGQDESMALLELRAKDIEVEFERILLGLSGDRLLLMVMEDAFGLRTELRFHDIARNPAVEPELFTFEPPESADVIGAPAQP